MKVVRSILGLIVGFLVIYIVTESIEVGLVSISSEQSMEYLMTQPVEYFKIRNTTWILVFKLFYTLFAAFLGGYLTSKIAKDLAFKTIITLSVLQGGFVIWAGFFSEMSNTGPTWMWLGLCFVLPLGIGLGHNVQSRRSQKKSGL